MYLFVVLLYFSSWKVNTNIYINMLLVTTTLIVFSVFPAGSLKEFGKLIASIEDERDRMVSNICLFSFLLGIE